MRAERERCVGHASERAADEVAVVTQAPATMGRRVDDAELQAAISGAVFLCRNDVSRAKRTFQDILNRAGREEALHAALQIAAKLDFVEVVKYLVENGADPAFVPASDDDLFKYKMFTPMGSAAQTIALDSAREMSDQKLFLRGGTAAHAANGCLHTVTHIGLSPLMIAAKSNKGTAPQMVKLLLDRGANPCQVTNRHEKIPNTPLIVATYYNKPEAVKLICAAIRRGRPFYADDSGAAPTGQKMEKKKAKKGKTPQPSPGCWEEWTEANMVDDQPGNNTALHQAAAKGFVACIEALLDASADPNRATKRSNNTPLMLAAREGHFEAVKVLAARGADSRRENAEGMNAFWLAAEAMHVHIMCELASTPAEKLEVQITFDALVDSGDVPALVAESSDDEDGSYASQSDSSGADDSENESDEGGEAQRAASRSPSVPPNDRREASRRPETVPSKPSAAAASVSDANEPPPLRSDESEGGTDTASEADSDESVPELESDSSDDDTSHEKSVAKKAPAPGPTEPITAGAVTELVECKVGSNRPRMPALVLNVVAVWSGSNARTMEPLQSNTEVAATTGTCFPPIDLPRAKDTRPDCVCLSLSDGEWLFQAFLSQVCAPSAAIKPGLRVRLEDFDTFGGDFAAVVIHRLSTLERAREDLPAGRQVTPARWAKDYEKAPLGPSARFHFTMGAVNAFNMMRKKGIGRATIGKYKVSPGVHTMEIVVQFAGAMRVDYADACLAMIADGTSRANVLLDGQAEREVIDGHVPANAIIRIQEWEVHPDNTGVARINRLKVLRKYYRPQYKARSPWPGTEWEPHPLVVPADELQVVRDAVKCEKEEKKARSKQAKREAATSGKSRYAEPEVVQSEDASAYARMRAQEMGAGKGKEAAEEPKNEEDGHEHVAEAPRAHDSGRSRREEEQQRQKALVEERRLEKAAKKAAKKKKKSAKVAVDGDATADAKATEEDIEPPDSTEAALTRGADPSTSARPSVPSESAGPSTTAAPTVKIAVRAGANFKPKIGKSIADELREELGVEQNEEQVFETGRPVQTNVWEARGRQAHYRGVWESRERHDDYYYDDACGYEYEYEYEGGSFPPPQPPGTGYNGAHQDPLPVPQSAPAQMAHMPPAMPPLGAVHLGRQTAMRSVAGDPRPSAAAAAAAAAAIEAVSRPSPAAAAAATAAFEAISLRERNAPPSPRPVPSAQQPRESDKSSGDAKKKKRNKIRKIYMDDDDECVFCLDELRGKEWVAVVGGCGHVACWECAQEYMERVGRGNTGPSILPTTFTCFKCRDVFEEKEISKWRVEAAIDMARRFEEYNSREGDKSGSELVTTGSARGNAAVVVADPGADAVGPLSEGEDPPARDAAGTSTDGAGVDWSGLSAAGASAASPTFQAAHISEPIVASTAVSAIGTDLYGGSSSMSPASMLAQLGQEARPSPMPPTAGGMGASATSAMSSAVANAGGTVQGSLGWTSTGASAPHSPPHAPAHTSTTPRVLLRRPPPGFSATPQNTPLARAMVRTTHTSAQPRMPPGVPARAPASALRAPLTALLVADARVLALARAGRHSTGRATVRARAAVRAQGAPSGAHTRAHSPSRGQGQQRRGRKRRRGHDGFALHGGGIVQRAHWQRIGASWRACRQIWDCETVHNAAHAARHTTRASCSAPRAACSGAQCAHPCARARWRWRWRCSWRARGRHGQRPRLQASASRSSSCAPLAARRRAARAQTRATRTAAARAVASKTRAALPASAPPPAWRTSASPRARLAAAAPAHCRRTCG